MEVGGQLHALPAPLPLPLARKETLYPCYRSLGGPQRWFGRSQKISPSQGFAPQTVRTVASRYTG